MTYFKVIIALGLAWFLGRYLDFLPFLENLTLDGFLVPDMVIRALRFCVFAGVTFLILLTPPADFLAHELPILAAVFIVVSLPFMFKSLGELQDQSNQIFDERLTVEIERHTASQQAAPTGFELIGDLFDEVKKLVIAPSVEPLAPGGSLTPGGEQYQALLSQAQRETWMPVLNSPWEHFGHVFKWTLPISLLLHVPLYFFRLKIRRRRS